MRAFVAIALPGEVQASCRRLIAALRPEAPKVSWVKPENIHLTLRFLSDIEPEAGERLMRAVGEAAAAIPPFGIAANGLGVFPNPRKASVAWVGLHTEGEGLALLQAAAEQAARAEGLEAERRVFRPHLTLGRIRKPGAAIPWAALIARHADFQAGAWTVHDVALFSSELHPTGAQYQRITAVSLGTPA